MATIRPDDLPAAASVNPAAALIVDDGSTVEKATPQQVVDSAIPLASQAEAEAGTDNAKRTTPLRVAQAIEALTMGVDYQGSYASNVARTLLARLQDRADIRDWGVNTLGSNDYGTEISAALAEVAGTTLHFPKGTFLCGTSLTQPNNTHIQGASKFGTIIKKVFNGDLFTSMGNGASIDNLTLDGDSTSSYTGKCINIISGNGVQRITNSRLIFFEDACIWFAYNSGSRSHFENLDVWRRGPSSNAYIAEDGSGDYAIIIEDIFNSAGCPRTFVHVETARAPTISFGGSNNTFWLGGPLYDFELSDESQDVQINGVRVAGTSPITYKGSGQIVGCDVYPDQTISTGTAWVIGPNQNNGTITDSSNPEDDNLIYSAKVQTWTPTVKFGQVAGTSGPATPGTAGTEMTLGAGGSISGRYQRQGKLIKWDIRIILGTSPTIPAGGMTISLPFPSDKDTPLQFGSGGKIQDGSNNYYSITARIVNYNGDAGDPKPGTFMSVERVLGTALAAASLNVTGTNPTTLGSNCAIWLSGTYYM